MTVIMLSICAISDLEFSFHFQFVHRWQYKYQINILYFIAMRGEQCTVHILINIIILPQLGSSRVNSNIDKCVIIY